MSSDFSDFLSLLQQGAQIYSQYVTRKQAVTTDFKALLYDTLDMVRTLTHKHLEAIDKVVSPISKERDLVSTCNRYTSLVMNEEFPSGYGLAQGVFKEALESKWTKKGTIRENLEDVSTRLAYFQWAAFVLRYDSYVAKNQIQNAENLYSQWMTRGYPSPHELGLDLSALAEKVRIELAGLLEWLDSEKRYLFRWSQIPGNDEGVLRDFLNEKFGLDWIRQSQFRKIDERRITGFDTAVPKRSLSITLGDNKQVTLELEGRKDTGILVAESPPWTRQYPWSPQLGPNIYLKPKEPRREIPGFKSPNDVLELVHTWFSDWQEHIHRTLNYGRGLDFAIGQLKAQSGAI